jgi:ABC-2 type transport system ATP-binding protein
MSIPLETHNLGKRYGSSWALKDCSISIPPGRTVGLIGPNGAGKSTLLRMAVGLTVPSAGSLSIFDLNPMQNARAMLPRIGFVAQDRPLYARLSVDDMCQMAARLNISWDREFAISRLDRLGIDRKRSAGKLSGGQQAQVALVLALAKHPELILLDEPTASLDPLARREFLQILMEFVVNDGATVVLSSHNVPDLERVCDHVVILAHGQVRVSDDLDTVLATHRLLVGPRADTPELAHVGQVIHASHTDRQSTVLVRKNGHVYDARWDVRAVGFEELVLGYLEKPGTDRQLIERHAS